MSNRAIRFGRGQGLEAAADLYTDGLSELCNADLDLADVIQKRDGAESFLLTQAAGAPIVGATGIWYRNTELCVENTERLHALRECGREPVATVGNFVDRGRWSRGTLRELAGVQEAAASIQSAVRLETEPDQDDQRCALEAWTTSVAASGVRARTIGAGIEDQVTVDANGSNVRGGMTIGSTQGLLTWQTTSPADTIRYAAWNVGQVALGSAQTILTTVMAGDPIKRWDFYAEAEQSGGFGVWCALTSTTNLAVRARKSSTGGLTAQLNINTGLVSTARRAASVYVAPTPVATDVYRVIVAAAVQSGGPERYVVAAVDYNVAANTLTLVSGPTANTAAITGTLNDISAAQSWLSPATVCHVAFESGTGTTVLRNLTFGVGDVSVRVLQRVGMVTHFRGLPAMTRSHRNVIVLSDETDDVLSNGYFLCEPITTDGTLAGTVFGEVLARAWVGQARDGRGVVENQQSLVAIGDALIWAADGRSDSGDPDTTPRQVCQARWQLARAPQAPASVDEYAVQAFGGYARFYDSAITAEHDWHSTPFFTVTGQAGGTLTVGALYTVAVQWHWVDATTRVHRSAFSTGSVILTAGQGTVRATIRTLQFTERPGVKAIVWISGANQSSLYRAATVAAALDDPGGDTVLVNITAPVNTSGELLVVDEVGGEQAFITDFCSYAAGRFWGASSRREGIVQFSTLPTEGFAARWDIDGLSELSARVTAVLELEGLPIVFATQFLSALQGGGPDNVGLGDFALREISTTLGAVGQHAVSRSALGLVFDTGRGPRLLNRGLTVDDIGAPVSRLYELAGDTVRAMAYRGRSGTVVLLNELTRQVLAFGDETVRWAEEEREDGCTDLAADRAGRLAWLRAGDVLVETSSPSYSPIVSWLYASGGIVPAHIYAPRRRADYLTGDPWVIEGTPSIIATEGAPGLLGNLMMRTANIGGEALRATDTTIGSIATQSLAGAAFVRLTSAVTGSVCGKQNGIDSGWNVIHDSVAGFEIFVANQSGINAICPVTLASSGLGVWRVLCWVIDRVSGNVRFATDLEVGVPAALPSGTIEAVGIPLRIGDSRLPASTIRSLDGDTGGVVLWRPEAPAALNVSTLAQQLKAAWDSGTGIPVTRSTVDGDVAVPMSWSTGWLRVPNEGDVSHIGMVPQQAHLAGEYEGDHDLVFRVYCDYETTPRQVCRVSELRVALNRYAGRQYLYRVPLGGLGTVRAVRIEVEDGGREVASYRTSRMDVQFEPVGEEHLQLDAELIATQDP